MDIIEGIEKETEKRQFYYNQFRYLNLIITVGSCNYRDFIWLNEFILPQFEVIDSSSSDCIIHVIMYDKQFDTLLQRGSKGNESIDGFHLDTKIVKLILWDSSPGKMILFDEEFKVFYIISDDGKKVYILAHSEKSIAFRTALMRVMVEYAVNRAHSHTGGFLHSSAFRYRDQGIVIAGPKNSGKTSLLIYFLQNLSAQFISNDRVFISMNGCGSVIHGIPTVITVLENSLSMFPRVKMNLLQYYYHHRYTIGEILRRGCIPYTLEKGEFTLSAGQFYELLDIIGSSDAPLSAVLFPRICMETCSLSLRRLSLEVILERLQESRFAKNIEEKKTIFCADAIDGTKTLNYHEFCRRIACSVPCFDFYMGPDPYKNKHIQVLLENMLLKNGITI
ncbi:hypothetical protein ACFL1T_03015 [Chlamydiota bacterium]